jgi:uncharacterized protein YggE
MKKKWFIAVSLALVIAVAGLVGCSPQGSVSLGEAASGLKFNLSNQQEGIWVSGSGKVSAVPDTAILSLGIESQEASVALAQEQAKGAMNAVMSALTGSGIAEKDIQTQYFNIQKVTRWDEKEGREVVIGYRVTNAVTAKVREMDRVGAVIDAVAVAGGDLTRIDSIGFTIDEPSAYYDEARAKAMADAAAKAGQLAEMAGVKLGKPTYIVENTSYPYPIYRQDFYGKVEAAPAMETPISAGEMEISLSVQVAYAILD